MRPAWVGVTPWRDAHQQRGAERLLHVADAGRGGGQREMRALRAVRDAAGLDDVAEQAEIGEVEVHAASRFALSEGKLRQIADCTPVLLRRHIRRRRSMLAKSARVPCIAAPANAG